MAASKVSIANRALQLLGATRITSLSQNHPNARSMNAAFEPVRDALLRRYVWRFSVKRASVAADATQTVWGALNRFALPADFARLIRDDETGVRTDWRIEGRFIVTSYAAPLQFKYASIVDDPAQYDPFFVELLAAELAGATCEEITGSTAKLQMIEARIREARSAARQADAFETDAQEPLADEWLDSVR